MFIMMGWKQMTLFCDPYTGLNSSTPSDLFKSFIKYILRASYILQNSGGYKDEKALILAF